MQLRNIPFNVSILNPESDFFFGLTPTISLSMFDQVTGDFSEGGLFSNEIFGRQGEKERNDRFSFVDLKVKVFHPLYFEELSNVKGLYGGIILGRSYAKWDAKEKDFVPAKILEGETGISFFLKHFNDIKFRRNKSQKRDKRIKFMEDFKDKALLSKYLVIPAGLRDLEFDENGRPIVDDLNPLYNKLISNANTISPAIDDEDDPTLNRARGSMQLAVNNVYKFIFDLVKGKRGFLLSKVASVKVAGTTRNVISTMEVGSKILGDPRQPTIDTTIVGLPQFMSATRYKMKYQFKSGAFSDFFTSEGVGTRLINRKTLELEDVTLNPRTSDKWLTSEGQDKLMGAFIEPKSRHKPVVIDGMYLGLIYQDDKYYKLFRDISELPEHLDRDNVRPVTYAEMFYAHAEPLMENTYHFATRYPVTSSESIQAGKTYLRSTEEALQLTELGSDWGVSDHNVLEFPNTLNKSKFFETQSVHPSSLGLYGADQIQVCV